MSQADTPARRSLLSRAAALLTGLPAVDVAASAAFVAAYWFAGPLAENRDAIAGLDPDGYRDVVQLLANVGAALLGLTLTAMAIVLAITPGDRLRHLLAFHRPTIVGAFVAAARALIALTALSVYLLVFRHGGDPNRLLRSGLYGSLILSGLSLVRLVYVLNYVLRIGTLDKHEGTEGIEEPRRGRQHRNRR